MHGRNTTKGARRTSSYIKPTMMASLQTHHDGKSSGLRKGYSTFFTPQSRRGGDDAIGGDGALECTQHGGGYLRAHARLGFVRGHVSL